MVVCGSSLFFIYGYTPEAASQTATDTSIPWPRMLLLVASAIGVASALGWLSAEAAALTGTWGAWQDVVDWDPIGTTSSLMCEAALLALAFAACLVLRPNRTLWAIASVLGALSIVSFAWTGHGSIGAVGTERLHRFADVLHLLVGRGLDRRVTAARRWVVGRTLRTASHRRAGNESRGRSRDFRLSDRPIVALLLLSGSLANSWFLGLVCAHWRAALVIRPTASH